MVQHWPLFDLKARTSRLEVRLPTDDELPALIEAARDIHDADAMPFSTPWTRLESPAFERGILQHQWSLRASFKPESWTAGFAVFVGGQPVGCQDLAADNFAVLRTVASGSWLSRAYQGRGLGTEMRAAVLHLAFAGFGARVANSEAFAGNEASAGVSRRVGYEANGTEWVDVDGKAVLMNRFLLTRERWLATRSLEVTLEGVEPCLELVGAA